MDDKTMRLLIFSAIIGLKTQLLLMIQDCPAISADGSDITDRRKRQLKARIRVLEEIVDIHYGSKAAFCDGDYDKLLDFFERWPVKQGE